MKRCKIDQPVEQCCNDLIPTPQKFEFILVPMFIPMPMLILIDLYFSFQSDTPKPAPSSGGGGGGGLDMMAEMQRKLANR